eukprot:PhF_6_TR8475/c0_g1_i1/m.13249
MYVNRVSLGILAACSCIFIVVLKSQPDHHFHKPKTAPPSVPDSPRLATSAAVRASSWTCESILHTAIVMPCPEPMDWVPHVASRYPRGSWTYVEVGANKGYGIQDMIATLTGVPYHNPQHLHHEFRQRYWPKNLRVSPARRQWMRKQFCGMCCDCKKSFNVDNGGGSVFLPSAIQASSAVAYAVELTPSTADWLREYFSGDPRVRVIHAGVSETPGVIRMPKSATAGDETVSLNSATSSSDTVETRVGPLQTLLPPGIGHIDFLSTDTEGFDRKVFEGARKLFVDRQISVYVFEVGFHVHRNTFASSPTYLQEMLDELKSLGYRCLAPAGKLLATDNLPQYVRLDNCSAVSGAAERLMGWNNILCYNQYNETLHDIFEHNVIDKPRKEFHVSC